MQGRNKPKILIKIDNMQAMSTEMIAGGTDIGNTLDALTNEIISIGEMLVDYDELGAELIGCLESLAEIIEKIRLAHNMGKPIRMPVDMLLSKLVAIRHDIEVALPKEKKLVFFLPYKASMWDSLESVWEKAAADEVCDAVVMPIPYCDRNPNGSAGEWHWEGNEFPKKVPITDYRKINLAEIHPDEIYIHNPYDGYNLVTSVHPDYYSDKLKQYTEKLVYYPYFVSDENSATPAWAERHAQMPVYVNADIIVQQSENMRKVYIEALVNLYGENTRHIWEEKIKGWGSPKFDKVKNTKIDDQDIPSDWLRKIQKSDGTRKKVIMYGTGLGEMLQSGEKLLDKVENTIEFFSKLTDDVMMLWRPHPLIPATLESMRPELAQRYAAIVKDYKKVNWGIYDDTADLNRSIAICDAYYGDYSSVMHLFQKGKKPVMKECVKISN